MRWFLPVQRKRPTSNRSRLSQGDEHFVLDHGGTCKPQDTFGNWNFNELTRTNNSISLDGPAVWSGFESKVGTLWERLMHSGPGWLPRPFNAEGLAHGRAPGYNMHQGRKENRFMEKFSYVSYAISVHIHVSKIGKYDVLITTKLTSSCWLTCLSSRKGKEFFTSFPHSHLSNISIAHITFRYTLYCLEVVDSFSTFAVNESHERNKLRNRLPVYYPKERGHCGLACC